MKQSISLSTNGYEFVIYLSSINAGKDRLGIITRLIPNQRFQVNPIRSEVKTIFWADIEKLSLYLEAHLENNLNNDSGIFMSYDCAFQIQALKGVMAPYINKLVDDDSAFTIRCLINVGIVDGKLFSEYLGGESVVSVGECRNFINSLKKSHVIFSNLNIDLN